MFKDAAFICPVCKEEVVGMGLDRHSRECRVYLAEIARVNKILEQNPELSVEVVYSLV